MRRPRGSRAALLGGGRVCDGVHLLCGQVEEVFDRRGRARAVGLRCDLRSGLGSIYFVLLLGVNLQGGGLVCARERDRDPPLGEIARESERGIHVNIGGGGCPVREQKRILISLSLWLQSRRSFLQIASI